MKLTTYKGVLVREGSDSDRQAIRDIGHWDALPIRAGDLVSDVGAHIGGFSLRALAAEARVVAWEAHPENYQVLRENLAPHEQAEARWAAVNAGSDAYVALYVTRGKSTMSHSVTAVKGRERVGVPSVPLEEVLAQHPNVVKIDVEGAEHELGLDILRWPEATRAVGIDIGLPCLARQKRDWWGPSAEAICDNLEAQGFSTQLSRDWDSYTELRRSPSGAMFTWAEVHMVYTRVVE